MKKLNVAFSIVAALASASAFAVSDNTIQFQGEVADQTCNVNINGNTQAPVILLPTVPAASLATAGETAGQTTFTIGLTGCTAPQDADVDINTIFVGNNLNTNNRLGNTNKTDSAATNVSLELVDPGSNDAALDLTGTKPNSGLVLKANATSAEHDFAVRYYAEDKATAGFVNGSVQYAISYK